MHTGLHIKYRLFLSDFNETWILSTDFRKILKIYLMKIPPVGAELFHVDGRRHMKEPISAFRNFVNATKKFMTGYYGNRVKQHGLNSCLSGRALELVRNLVAHGRASDGENGEWSV